MASPHRLTPWPHSMASLHGVASRRAFSGMRSPACGRASAYPLHHPPSANHYPLSTERYPGASLPLSRWAPPTFRRAALQPCPRASVRRPLPWGVAKLAAGAETRLTSAPSVEPRAVMPRASRMLTPTTSCRMDVRPSFVGWGAREPKKITWARVPANQKKNVGSGAPRTKKPNASDLTHDRSSSKGLPRHIERRRDVSGSAS
jgi:hypothetical protein